MELIAKLGEYLLDEAFFETGRTLKNLGINNMSPEELNHYIETGEQ